MILRIVKMTFQSDKLAAFHALFDQHKNKIRHSPGCHRLELHADAKADNVRYTYSYWEDEASLNAYRYSDLFGEVWPKTKQLFADRPEAFSLQFLERID
ncbi:MAG: antibiotic biosynthesis monooxygenase [Bacteroidota bacterium]